jgi:cell division protein FtsW
VTVLEAVRRGRAKTRAQTRAEPAPAHYVLLIATNAVLNIIGVVMVLSASSVFSLTSYGSAWYFFQRQIIWTVLGLVGFLVAVSIDYRQWQRWVRPLLIVTAGLLVLVLVPGIGSYVAGSRRWLGFGVWRFQPTELAKLAIVLFAALVLSGGVLDLWDWS